MLISQCEPLPEFVGDRKLLTLICQYKSLLELVGDRNLLALICQYESLPELVGDRNLLTFTLDTQDSIYRAITKRSDLILPRD